MTDRLGILFVLLALALSGCGSSPHRAPGPSQTGTNPTGMTSSTPLGPPTTGK